MGKLIDFHPSATRPTEQALDRFATHSTTLCDLMMAELENLILVDCQSYAETQVVQVEGSLWCLRANNRGVWGMLFFVELASDSIMTLNGYTKKSKKMPKLSTTQIRKARYLIKELHYAR